MSVEHTVLIVDDDMMNIKTAQNILQAEYRVATAISGEMAFKILEKLVPNLILLDINMPHMDGFAVLEQLRRNERTMNIPVIFLTAEQGCDVETRALEAGAEDFVSKPFNPSVLRNRIKRSIEMEMYQKHLKTMVKEQAETIVEHVERINSIQQGMIISMANMIESRDGSTGEHVKRTGIYVEVLVNALKRAGLHADVLTDEYAEKLCKAAYMHDIGKIKVDDAILRKKGKLTEEEFEQMKLHVRYGGEMIHMTMDGIEDQEYVQIASDMASYHHERWDGSGYCKGLLGTQIPLPARIMALADVYDALTSKRCYKEAMSVEDAFALIDELLGTQFDPEVAQVFLDNRQLFAEKTAELVTDL